MKKLALNPRFFQSKQKILLIFIPVHTIISMSNEKSSLHESVMIAIAAITLAYFFLKIVFL
jgi:hypothetical protein